MPASVAVTGARGRIGRSLVEHLSRRGYRLTSIDRPGSGAAIELDLSRAPPPDLFEGVEVVVHLAADAGPHAAWESLLPNNIEAAYHVAAAAIRARCRRIIFASSVHAVLAARQRPVRPDAAVAPADLYGVSKCFAEALAFWCAHESEVSAAAVRIGAFESAEPGLFIAAPDLMELFERAITADYSFAILHAAAPGPQALLDTSATEQLLGWRPRSP